MFALVRRRKKWLVYSCHDWWCGLLADGIITPPISITSAIEGLKQFPVFHDYQTLRLLYIVLVLFHFSFFCSNSAQHLSENFWPIMLSGLPCWLYWVLFILSDDFHILKAFNPYYAIKFLSNLSEGFWILGAVFLCTTGAEALYSDLGHCGRGNIRISWIFVKTCLLIKLFWPGCLAY